MHKLHVADAVVRQRLGQALAVKEQVGHTRGGCSIVVR